ncbi:T-complex protein 11-like protein 2 isoform X2 [Heterocephalus glaber]|uniref:T-complex protein 11-like protein 2 isoform X2 n=1 Tax=Heterocephalus glaber TaxID=10181 RepID=A0AAX6P6R2_HETGA|nr:T-complex protein 11-like protein 2 isoform X2 [Heterocephalus glaber]
MPRSPWPALRPPPPRPFADSHLPGDLKPFKSRGGAGPGAVGWEFPRCGLLGEGARRQGTPQLVADLFRAHRVPPSAPSHRTMPLHSRKQLEAEDQPGDLDSPRCSESLAVLSDCECSRQSFASDSSSKSSSPASSPPRGVTFDDVMAATRNLSNLTLAHEIAVNENFQLKEEALPENSVAGRVRSIVHQAFWDVLESELTAEPPEFAHAIRLFEEIREILLSFLTPGGNRLRTQICEVLDPELIRQQAEHSSVDITGLAAYVIGMMGKLCAPVRDSDIRELKATGNIVEALRQIYHVLDLMKMDMANFTIWSLRPHLQRQLVEYERTKFQEILEESPSALDQTTEWIRESVKEELLSLSEAALTPRAENLSPRLVLNNSYLKLLQWDYQRRDLPEASTPPAPQASGVLTLVTDGMRLQELTGKLNQLKMIACLCLITNSTVGAVSEGLPGLLRRLKRTAAVLLEGMHEKTFNLQGALSSLGVQTWADMNKALAERGFPALGAEVQANLVGQFSSLKEENNPIRALIDKRIQLYMKSLLCLPSPSKSMPPIPGGLAVIQQELEALGTQFANIVNLNMQVYGPFYANILRKLLFGEEASQGADAALPAN